MQVSLNDLRAHEKNHEIYGEETVEKLAESIESHGLLKPIIITADNRVVSGNRRVAAAKSLGWTTIDAAVLPESTAEHEILLRLLLENEYRTKTNAQKTREGIQYEELYKSMNKAGARLGSARDRAAGKIGMSAGSFEASKAIVKEIDELKETAPDIAAGLEDALNKSVRSGKAKLDSRVEAKQGREPKRVTIAVSAAIKNMSSAIGSAEKAAKTAYSVSNKGSLKDLGDSLALIQELFATWSTELEDDCPVCSGEGDCEYCFEGKIGYLVKKFVGQTK